MTTLDAVIRSLLNPAAPWQLASTTLIWQGKDRVVTKRLVVNTRYRERSSGPYLLHHTPAGEYGPSADIALSRRDGQPPSAADVQAIVNALARVVGWSGLEVVVMETVFGGRPARRLYWPPQYIPAVRTQTYQATIYDLDERYEWNWQTMAEGPDRREVARQGWERAAGMVIMKVEAMEAQ